VDVRRNQGVPSTKSRVEEVRYEGDLGLREFIVMTLPSYESCSLELIVGNVNLVYPTLLPFSYRNYLYKRLSDVHR